MSTIIIGGGFTGLIAKLFIPDALIITYYLGDRHFLGRESIKIYKNEENSVLLKKLNITCSERAMLVGYEVNGVILDHPTEEFFTKYAVVKMGELKNPNPIIFNYKSAADILYDITPFELYSALYNNIKSNKPSPIFGVVDEINDDYIYFGKEKLKYDLLISTIPSPFFWKAYGNEKVRHGIPIVFTKSTVPPEIWSDKYDFINYTSFAFNRVQAIKGGYLYESLSEIKIPKQYESQEVMFGRFIDAPDNEPPNDKIKFVGRFAEWNHQIRIEHTVQKIRSIINE